MAAVENAGDENSPEIDENVEEGFSFSEHEDIYEVERILGVTKHEGKPLYRVRWQGYGPEEDTWEPRENLLTCEDLVEEFIEKQKQRKQKINQTLAKKDKKPSKKRTPPKQQATDGQPKRRRSSEKDASDDNEATPSQTNAVEEGKSPASSSGTEEGPPPLKDPFWDNLEKGLITFEGDMYSKVKSRRATLDAKKANTSPEALSKCPERPVRAVSKVNSIISEVDEAQEQREATPACEESKTDALKEEMILGDEGNQAEDMYSKVKSRRAFLDAKKHEDAKQEEEKKRNKEAKKAAKKEHKSHRHHHHHHHHHHHKKSKKDGSRKPKVLIDLEAIGSLETATQKTLSMSPSVLERETNAANLFHTPDTFLPVEEVLTVAKLEEKTRNGGYGRQLSGQSTEEEEERVLPTATESDRRTSTSSTEQSVCLAPSPDRKQEARGLDQSSVQSTSNTSPQQHSPTFDASSRWLSVNPMQSVADTPESPDSSQKGISTTMWKPWEITTTSTCSNSSCSSTTLSLSGSDYPVQEISRVGIGNRDDVQNLGQDLAAKVSLHHQDVAAKVSFHPEKEVALTIPNTESAFFRGAASSTVDTKATPTPITTNRGEAFCKETALGIPSTESLFCNEAAQNISNIQDAFCKEAVSNIPNTEGAFCKEAVSNIPNTEGAFCKEAVSNIPNTEGAFCKEAVSNIPNTEGAFCKEAVSNIPNTDGTFCKEPALNTLNTGGTYSPEAATNITTTKAALGMEVPCTIPSIAGAFSTVGSLNTPNAAGPFYTGALNNITSTKIPHKLPNTESALYTEAPRFIPNTQAPLSTTTTYNTPAVYQPLSTANATPTTNTSKPYCPTPTYGSSEGYTYTNKTHDSQKQTGAGQVPIWRELQNFVEKESMLQSVANNNNMAPVSKVPNMASPSDAVRNPVSESSIGGIVSPQAMMTNRGPDEKRQHSPQRDEDAKMPNKMVEAKTNKDVNEKKHRKHVPASGKTTRKPSPKSSQKYPDPSEKAKKKDSKPTEKVKKKDFKPSEKVKKKDSEPSKKVKKKDYEHSEKVKKKDSEHSEKVKKKESLPLEKVKTKEPKPSKKVKDKVKPKKPEFNKALAVRVTAPGGSAALLSEPTLHFELQDFLSSLSSTTTSSSMQGGIEFDFDEDTSIEEPWMVKPEGLSPVIFSNVYLAGVSDRVELSKDYRALKAQDGELWLKCEIPLDVISAKSLKQAVKEGHTQRVREALWLNGMHDLEQPDPVCGTTLLMLACMNRQDEIAKLLIANGALVNIPEKSGLTPLMYATELGLYNLVAILLEAGAHVNLQQNGTGETAMMMAGKRGHADIVNLLLMFGANWAILTSSADTVAGYAIIYKHPDVYDVLNNHINRVTMQFESTINQYLCGTAKLVKPVFPLQCFRIRESTEHHVYLNHDTRQHSYNQGCGNVLFIGHAHLGLNGLSCRLTGHSYVYKVMLNGHDLPQLSQGSNFLLSFLPRNGRNVLTVKTLCDPYSKLLLFVGAYSLQITSDGPQIGF